MTGRVYDLPGYEYDQHGLLAEDYSPAARREKALQDAKSSDPIVRRNAQMLLAQEEVEAIKRARETGAPGSPDA